MLAMGTKPLAGTSIEIDRERDTVRSFAHSRERKRERECVCQIKRGNVK